MNAASLLDAILSVAKAAAPIVGKGAPEAIALGERVVELIDHAKLAYHKEVPPQLDEQREEIETRIQLHVNATAEKLRGGNQPGTDRSGIS